MLNTDLYNLNQSVTLPTRFATIPIENIEDFINKKIVNAEVIEKISIKTRQYAKRQVTWARGHMSSWKKIKAKNLNSFLKKI